MKAANKSARAISAHKGVARGIRKLALQESRLWTQWERSKERGRLGDVTIMARLIRIYDARATLFGWHEPEPLTAK